MLVNTEFRFSEKEQDVLDKAIDILEELHDVFMANPTEIRTDMNHVIPYMDFANMYHTLLTLTADDVLYIKNEEAAIF